MVSIMQSRMFTLAAVLAIFTAASPGADKKKKPEPSALDK